MFLFLAAVLVFTAASVTPLHQVVITEEHGLEKLLCNSSFASDTVLVLSANITHIIGNVSFCVVNTTGYSLTLTGDSTSKQALVNCPVHEASSGLAFDNIHNLTLNRLVVTGCGGYLRELPSNILESIDLSVYLIHHSAAVLLLLPQIKAIVLEDVNITSYYGFAILAINPMNATINKLAVTISYGRTDWLGSGVFLLFIDTKGSKSSVPLNTSVHKSVFHHNYDYTEFYPCTSDFKDEIKYKMIYAAALTVHYRQASFIANVNVVQSNFTYNYGIFVGAVLLVHYNSYTYSQTTISHSSFYKNFAYGNCSIGTDLSFFLYDHYSYNDSNQMTNDCYPTGMACHFYPLLISNTAYVSHDQLKSTCNSGIIFMHIFSAKHSYVNVKFSRISFKFIPMLNRGSCISATTLSADTTTNYVHTCIILESVSASNIFLSEQIESTKPYKYSSFFFTNIDCVVLNGSSNFTDNTGSVFDIRHSQVILGGQLHFENNTADTGPAFKLTGLSRFILQNGLSATFVKNSALQNYGGVIYAHNEVSSDNCMFTSNSSNSEINMLFKENTAGSTTNAIFSSNLAYCRGIDDIYYKRDEAKSFFCSISNGSLDGTNMVSTIEKILCFCNDCHFSVSVVTKIYPGISLQLPIAAFDSFNQPSFLEIALSLRGKNIFTSKFYPTKSWYISGESRYMLLQDKCTLVNVTLLKHKEVKNVVQFTHLALLVSNYQSSNSIAKYSLLPQDCPIGFEFDESTDRCHCSHVFCKLGYQPICQIIFHANKTHITISTPPVIIKWIGALQLGNNTMFGVSPTFFLYSNLYRIHYDTYIISDDDNGVFLTSSKNTEDNVTLCPTNRHGVLCSQCAPGYSVVFGSSQCLQCSNWWLLTLIIYGVSGLLVIYLLHTLKLTIATGTVNSIILYAQIISIGQGVGMSVANGKVLFYYNSLIKGLLFLINLSIDFEVPLCFYDGMTELCKSGLGLLFPVYLLSIVIGLSVISRYSVRLSNKLGNSSIQVLVTVVHLSFSTLLTSAFNVFTPAYIYTNTSDAPLVVWQNDGTVEYGKGGHLILMIVTGLIVGPILTTYLTVLLAGRSLMKIKRVREYLRPIYEAIHAPYRPKREFFFLSSIILVAVLYLLKNIFISNHPTVGLFITIPLTSLYSIVLGFSRPFNEIHLNFLNIFVLSVLTLVVSSFWFIYVHSSDLAFNILLMICNTIIVLTMICIFFSHIPFLKRFLMKRSRLFKSSNEVSVNNRQTDMLHHGSFFESCEEREPLLSSSLKHQ